MLNTKWSDIDLNFLKDNYHCMSTKDISIHLGRSIQTIHTNAYKLNLHKSSHWTEEKIKYLIDNYGLKSLVQIGADLKLSKHLIRTKIRNLNLNKKKKFFDVDLLLSNKKCIYCSGKLVLNENITMGQISKKYYSCKSCLNNKIKSRESYKAKRFSGISKKSNRTKFEKKLLQKYHGTLRNALNRNINFCIDRESFIEILKLDCSYCGKKSTEASPNGLDRINSSLEYILSNVNPCCKNCNYAKNTLTVQEYIEHCKKVVNFNALKEGQ